jgi:hypothetical protein
MRSVLFASALLLVSTAARAQVSSTSSGSSPSRDWSATGARTVGTGANVVNVEGGWPGVAVELLHGYDERTDIGARIGFSYGFFGTTATTSGLDLNIPIRYRLSGTPARGFEIGIHAMPGIAVYSNNGTLFGIEAPVGIVASYRIDPRTVFNVSGEVPILLSFTHPLGLLFGPLVGIGGEYKLQNNLAATLQLRVGPEFWIQDNPQTHVAFQTLIGIAYALR